MSHGSITIDRMPRRPNYDKYPVLNVSDVGEDSCVAGWDQVGAMLRNAIAGKRRAVIAVEIYPGVHESQVLAALRTELHPQTVIEAHEAYGPAPAVNAMVERDLTDDPVFGRLTLLELSDFIDEDRRASLASSVKNATGVVLVFGTGATLIVPQPDVLIYADMARWEIQARQRRGEVGNLFIDNTITASPAEKYKRAFFLDWRLSDLHKRQLFSRVDFFLDTHVPDEPKLARGNAVRQGLKHCVTRPFRVVPFFDPGPWGGQWMKQVCDLSREEKNFAWCFDCVPEENSLLLQIGPNRIELPSINLVFEHPRELLGDAVFARFGNEFPIRFDLLDTMAGGNLSLQVHPLTDYILRKFGMHYTQDESYYMLDAADDATVYLGFREDINPGEFIEALREAQTNPHKPLDAQKFVNRWPAARHDHFRIPAGTIHCSGADGLVLEISATPFIFTFKLWDWGRLGLDGRPRPIHIEHGRRNVQFDRTTEWVRRNLVNRFEPIAAGEGWHEERTGLHETEFIETRRHWFTKPVAHHTNGGVNVLNLVHGEQAIVESPTNSFVPFVVHYAETFIVPAAVGAYTVRPDIPSSDGRCASIKAFVRAQP